MTWEQLIEPNLSLSEEAGLCLQYARRTFSAPKVEDTAYEALQAAKTVHWDRNFPEGVSVPVWFEWWGTIKWSDGVSRYQRYDHVAVRHSSGVIYSSPLKGRGRATFNNVDELCRAFGAGMKYLAWSEDISGVKVIKKEDDMKFTQNMLSSIWRMAFDTWPPKKEIEYWVGRTDEKELEDYLEGLYIQTEERRTKANRYDQDLATVKKGGAVTTPDPDGAKFRQLKDLLR